MEEPGKLKRALIDSSAGAISGGISRTVTSPLDVIKIRFQVCLCLGYVCGWNDLFILIVVLFTLKIKITGSTGAHIFVGFTT